MATSRSAPVHGDYASYFVPPKPAEQTHEHELPDIHINNSATSETPVLEAVSGSGQKRPEVDSLLEKDIEADIEASPRPLPWTVPQLVLIEPTPPSSVKGDASSISSVSSVLSFSEEPITPTPRRGSVTSVRKSGRIEDVPTKSRVSNDSEK